MSRRIVTLAALAIDHGGHVDIGRIGANQNAWPERAGAVEILRHREVHPAGIGYLADAPVAQQRDAPHVGFPILGADVLALPAEHNGGLALVVEIFCPRGIAQTVVVAEASAVDFPEAPEASLSDGVGNALLGEFRRLLACRRAGAAPSPDDDRRSCRPRRRCARPCGRGACNRAVSMGWTIVSPRGPSWS